MIVVTNALGHQIPVDFWKFPAGEVGVRVIPKNLPDQLTVSVTEDYSSETIMQLLMLSDALRRANRNVTLTLSIPYLPYSRQDRVCSEGESSGKALIIKLLKYSYNKIVTFDAHSDTHSGYYDNIQQDVEELVSHHKATALVFPDKGAKDKYYKLLPNELKCELKILYGTKFRNELGEITDYKVSDIGKLTKDDVVLVIDDICDGGRTFIELAKVLPKVKKKILHVSHGIFSKGVEVLTWHYDEIFAENKVKSHV